MNIISSASVPPRRASALSVAHDYRHATIVDTLPLRSRRFVRGNRNSLSSAMMPPRGPHQSGKLTGNILPEEPEFVGQESPRDCRSALECPVTRSATGRRVSDSASITRTSFRLPSINPDHPVETHASLRGITVCPARSISDPCADEFSGDTQRAAHSGLEPVRFYADPSTRSARASVRRVRGPPAG